MILVLGVAAGLLGGLIRSWIQKRPYQVPELKTAWLVAAAVLPQLLVFQIPATARRIPDPWAAPVLVASQLALLFFVWRNWHLTGMRLLGLGLALNLLVIILNGGLMPIRPEVIQALFPDAAPEAFQVGTRPGWSKNILLPAGETRLPWLSDAILLPAWFPWTRALSVGDLFVALGSGWLLALDAFGPKEQTQTAS